MLFNMDMFLVVLLFVLTVLVLSGFVSLCESKILAIIQLSVGPALFIFGLFTPMTDGIKLFMKFALFVVNFEYMYFLYGMLMVLFCMFFPWFFLPFGFIVLFDKGFSLYILLTMHLMTNVFGIFLVGCFLFSSCFVYLAAMRVLFFSIISESLMLIMLYSFYLLDFFSFFAMKTMCVNQLIWYNSVIMGLLFILIFWIGLLVDGLRLPFDYMECESELVAGLITELSGVFFVVYSVLEMNHVLISTMLFSSLCFGGLFMCFKSMFMLIVCFFVPSVICFSLKITTAQTFMLLFLFLMGFLLFLLFAVTKVMSVMF